MPPVVPYAGPVALGFSKYASPHMRKAQLIVPPAVSSTHNSFAMDTIATKEQIAASHDDSALTKSHSSDIELAIASGNALKREVDKHAEKFSRTVSTAVSQTRQLLELIREAVNKEDAAALKTVDELWKELELLFEAAKGTKDALPEFLEKQRNNMALYHGARMNETYRESQDELNMQHKKINLQHGLILEHQQAFQDFKASTVAKLKELNDLRERVSRLTLEKGNYKDEIDKYAQLLEKEQSTRAGDLKNAEALQKELDALTNSKKRLLGEVEGLQKSISDLQEKMQTAEQQITDRFTAELKKKTDQLVKESTKTTSLDTLLNSQKGIESNLKMEISRLKAENKQAKEKYGHVAAEHAQAFSKNKDLVQRNDALASENDRLRIEIATIRESLTKLPELEKNNARLLQGNVTLQERAGKLITELTQVKETSVKLNKELATLTESLQQVHSQNEGLETENNNLLSKQKKVDDDARKLTQAYTIVKSENAKLKEMVDKLNAQGAVGRSRLASGTDEAASEQKVRELEEQKNTLQKALDEWTALAKRSYKEYKEMLPTYKQAEALQKSIGEKDEQIKVLQFELSKTSSKSNGVGAGGDGAFWKAKYEKLMARVSD